MTTPRTPLLAFGIALGLFGLTATAGAQDLPRQAPAAPKKPAPTRPAPAPKPAAPEKAAPEKAAPEAPSEEAPSEEVPSEEGPAAAPEAPPADAAPADDGLEAEAAEAPEVPVDASEAEAGAPEAGETPEAIGAEQAAPTAEPALPEIEAGEAATVPGPSATTPVFAYYPTPPRDERPEILPYVEGEPVPEGYRVDTRIRKGLVIGGAVTFGVTYLAAAGLAVQAHNDEYDTADEFFEEKSDASVLFIPIAGPFIMAGKLGEERRDAAAVAAVDGLAQAAGLSMFIAGLAAPKTVLVKDETHSLSVTPTAPGASSGLTVVGSF